jgi:hypothetical protein
MMKLLFSATIVGCVALSTVAEALSAYDGSWDLVFVTQRGACDPTYSFSINITDGIVTHPNLVRFRGYVVRSGAVRASVTVQDKFASGSGKLARDSGRGTWSGRGKRDAQGTGPLNGISRSPGSGHETRTRRRLSLASHELRTSDISCTVSSQASKRSPL